MARHKRSPERRGRHRALLGVTGVSTVAVALTVGSGSRASAASVSTWDRVADCESSGNWAVNTGNGYYGGLQFSATTWSAYKPPGYPAYAHQATKQQQITVAERVLKAQGPGAWPVCSVKAGLARNGPAPRFQSQAAPASPRSEASRAERAVQYAVSKIGSGYLWGGNGPTRFDCSGLTSQAWLHAGVRIPRTAKGQLQGLPRVPLSSIRAGDLVIYSFRSYADHVALYAGNGRTIDTATHHTPAGSVGYSRLNRSGGTIAGVVRPYGSTVVTEAAPAKPARPEGTPSVKADTYTVRPGDWLSSIAPRHGTTWKKIFAVNRDRIADADLIFPGQVLRLPQTGTDT